MNTSIVEIDPAVYKAATEYFGLPEPYEVYLEDARAFISKRARSNTGTKYDIIVHDCFSGGSVPAQLFTNEFWNDVKRVLSPNGILAVVSACFLAAALF